MRMKGEAHDALLLMFQCEGVSPLMDGSKEQTLGKFHQIQEAGCEKKTRESDSPGRMLPNRRSMNSGKGQ